MTIISVTLGFILAVFAILFLTRGIDQSKMTAQRFFLGHRNLSSSEISLSIFSSWMSVGNVIVGALVLTVSFGYVAYWAVLTWVFGFWVLKNHAGLIVRAAHKYSTIHNFIADRFEHAGIGRLTAILTILTACGVVALELMVGAAIFLIVFPALPVLYVVMLCSAIISAIAIIYTWRGGIENVIRTDYFQSYALLAALVSLMVLTYLGQANDPEYTLAQVVRESLESEPTTHALFSLLGFLLGFGALQSFMLLGDMATWHRIRLGADENSVRRAATQAMAQNAIGWTLLFLAGLFLMQWSAPDVMLPQLIGDFQTILETQSQPLNSILQHIYGGNILAPALIFVTSFGLVCAILSTCDTFALVSVQALMLSFSKNQLNNQKNEGEGAQSYEILRKSRLLIIAIFVIAIGMFVLFTVAAIPLVSVIFLLLSIQTCIAPIAVAALYFPDEVKGLGRVITTTIYAALIAFVIIFILIGNAPSISLSYAYSYLAPLVAIIFPVAVLVGSGLAGKRRRKLTALPAVLILGRKRVEN